MHIKVAILQHVAKPQTTCRTACPDGTGCSRVGLASGPVTPAAAKVAIYVFSDDMFPHWTSDPCDVACAGNGASAGGPFEGES